jgi:hypothetical protein
MPVVPQGVGVLQKDETDQRKIVYQINRISNWINSGSWSGSSGPAGSTLTPPAQINADSTPITIDTTAILDMISSETGGPSIVALDSYGATTSIWAFRYSFGPATAPSPPQLNSDLGEIAWRPWLSGAFVTAASARIGADAMENFVAGTNQGTRIHLATTPVGSATRRDSVYFNGFGGVQVLGQAFASLPAAAAGNAGSIVYVTDSNTATPGAVVASGGTNHVLAYADVAGTFRVIAPTSVAAAAAGYPTPNSIYLSGPSGGDDTATVQAAINTVGAQPNGGRVVFGDGVWLVNNLLINKNNVWLTGSSQSSTILDYNGASTAGNVVNFSTVNFCGIENLTVSAIHSALTSGTGINVTGCDQFCARQFTVDGATTRGGLVGGRIANGVSLNSSGPGYYVLLSHFRINFCANAAIFGSVTGNGTTIDWKFAHGNIGAGWSGGNGTYGVFIGGTNSTGGGVAGGISCVDVNVLSAGTGWKVQNSNSPSSSLGSIGACLTMCGSDSSTQNNYDFVNVGPNSGGVQLINCWTGACSGNPQAAESGWGVRLQGCQGVIISGLRGQAMNAGLVMAITSGTSYVSDGIVISGCTTQSGNAANVTNWNNVGIPPCAFLMLCNNFSITGCTVNNDAQSIGGNLQYGAWASGSCGDGVIAGNTFECTNGPVFVQSFSSGGQIRVLGNQGAGGGAKNLYTANNLTTQLAANKCGGSYAIVSDAVLPTQSVVTSVNFAGSTVTTANIVSLFTTAVGGGSTNGVPVYCEGNNWIIG